MQRRAPSIFTVSCWSPTDAAPHRQAARRGSRSMTAGAETKRGRRQASAARRRADGDRPAATSPLSPPAGGLSPMTFTTEVEPGNYGDTIHNSATNYGDTIHNSATTRRGATNTPPKYPTWNYGDTIPNSATTRRGATNTPPHPASPPQGAERGRFARLGIMYCVPEIKGCLFLHGAGFRGCKSNRWRPPAITLCVTLELCIVSPKFRNSG